MFKNTIKLGSAISQAQSSAIANTQKLAVAKIEDNLNRKLDSAIDQFKTSPITSDSEKQFKDLVMDSVNQYNTSFQEIQSLSSTSVERAEAPVPTPLGALSAGSFAQGVAIAAVGNPSVFKEGVKQVKNLSSGQTESNSSGSSSICSNPHASLPPPPPSGEAPVPTSIPGLDEPSNPLQGCSIQ